MSINLKKLSLYYSIHPLEDECNDGESVDTSLSSGKILVMGDSQVRYLDRAFCAGDRKHRMLAYFPDAAIGYVGDWVGSVLAGEGVIPTICISVGGNKIGRFRS